MVDSVLAFLKCLRVGHKFYNSQSKRGYMTCVRCGHRRKY